MRFSNCAIDSLKSRRKALGISRVNAAYAASGASVAYPGFGKGELGVLPACPHPPHRSCCSSAITWQSDALPRD
jgi:hypothetical protein